MPLSCAASTQHTALGTSVGGGWVSDILMEIDYDVTTLNRDRSITRFKVAINLFKFEASVS